MSEKRGFEEWAMCELFGHQRIAGKVTEQQIGGSSFVRIDVPSRPGKKKEFKITKFLNPSAIYSITPVSEAVARAAAENIEVEPISRWDVAELVKRGSLRLPGMAEVPDAD